VEKLVVGYDDSDAARGALRWAIEYGRTRDAHLVVVFVISKAWQWELAAVQVNTDPIRAELKRRLEGKWTAPVRSAGVAYTTRLEIGRPAETLLTVARRHKASLIVVGMTHHGTVGDLVFRSTASEVSRRAIRPIVSVPASWQPD
jgi:nucleotide-binding universal stress UspA family protein